MNPCLKCGQAPSLQTVDVTSVSIAHHYHCACGSSTAWRFKAADCLADWNRKNPVEPVQVVAVQTKPAQQPTRAMSVLMHKKGELAYA